LKALAFKTIYRLDYPVSFGLVDHLGHYTQLVKEHSEKPAFTDVRSNLNLSNHTVTTAGKCGRDVFRFTLSLQTMNAVIEHEDGTSLSDLSAHPVIKLSDDVLRSLKESSFNKFERIGFRCFVLVQDTKFTFEKLKKHFIENFGEMSSALNRNFDMFEDIGVVFELMNSKNNDHTKISMGPYKKTEMEKYFSIKPDVEEGLIVDIDVWQKKSEIADLNLSKLSRHYFDTIKTTIALINEKTLEKV